MGGKEAFSSAFSSFNERLTELAASANLTEASSELVWSVGAREFGKLCEAHPDNKLTKSATVIFFMFILLLDKKPITIEQFCTETF